MTDKTPEQAEQALQNLLGKHKLTGKLSVKTVKGWVYDSHHTGALGDFHIYQQKVLKHFSKTDDIDKLNQILQVFVDAWNCFPHRALKGKSPNQLFQENSSNQPNRPDPANNKSMPKIVVGGREMEWDDYWEMIKQMEKLQIPFKHWIEQDLLPKYQKFLSQKYQKNTVARHVEVADHFFHRVLHMGFLELLEIRKEFIQKEFPRWWQTHVLMNSLKAKEVLSSLRKLFEFIELVYNVNKSQFGF